ncbi:hypothetical protein MGN70_004942 [Eutypa lata]|nr:hypothetical protein MGN70_004942 [Eutypa lata]
MVHATLSTVLIFALTALAMPAPAPQVPDPAQVGRIGNGAGEQFIGGQCISSADCAVTACCATLRRQGLEDIGVCSGLQADKQAGKIGCGFGDDGVAPPPPAATTTVNGGVAAPTGNAGLDEPGLGDVGTGNGQQFITGPCTSDADCASGCCTPGAGTDATQGTCAARLVALEAGGRGCNLGRS